MSSVESHLRLLDSFVCSAERLCEGALCYLGHRWKVSSLYVLYNYKSNQKVDHPLHEYLHHFVAGRNTKA